MVREALTLDRLHAMPHDEAAALLAVRRAEGLTTNEAALLAQWLAADPRHAHAFDNAQRGWSAFEDAGEDEILVAMRAHALAPAVRRRVVWPQIAAVAAALVLLVASSLVLLPSLLPGGNAPAVRELTWTRYEAGAGQVRTVNLADGSVMMLDAASVAETRLAADARAIRLVRGRALFEVSHDPARPFGVTAGDRRVVALGTRFEVDLGDGPLKVTLLRGKVAVEPLDGGGRTETLLPGQQFMEHDGGISVNQVPIVEVPAWSRGLVDFNDVPLGVALAQINRGSGRRIVIRDATVAGLRVSGQFRAGDADRFASTVGELHGLRVTRRGDEIELSRK